MATKYGTSGADLINGTALADEISGNGGNDVLSGLAGNDYILGGTGADKLSGGLGNDVLRGDEGADRLTGGPGRDTFVFTDRDHVRDTITDFVSGVDKIDLGWWVSNMGGAAFHLIGSRAFSHHAGEGRYANGQFQLDANGDGVADLTITMGLVHSGDFVFAAYGYWDY